jgi:hypothetical protein
MAVSLSTFPFATPYDSSADPATSVDPLGTNSLAELLADLILPGFTARMWRPRLLTFSAVASLVADRTAELMGKDDVVDSARLAFERLFVSALVRSAPRDPALAAGIRSIPGTDLARQALREGEPLTRSNFVKGQSVNGPTGVMARLTRRLQIVDTVNVLDLMGRELILAWSKDEDLGGILEGKNDAGDGATWLLRAAKVTRDALGRDSWPGKQSSMWDDLTRHLRPDRIGKNERKLLYRLLSTDVTGLRGRVLHLLVASVETYNHDPGEGRATVEPSVLKDGVRKRLTASVEDRLIDTLLATIEVHERCSSLLQEAFDTIRWALSSKGALSEDRVLADKTVAKTLDRVRKGLLKEVPAFDAAIERIINEVALLPTIAPPLRRMQADVVAATVSVPTLLAVLLDRHARVQKDKHKGNWIEQTTELTLMPGFGLAEAPTTYAGLYLHPFRITNAYSMLGELGVVKVSRNEEE